ncbi:hypothetical protein J6590_013502 [Homalodisca vitripennis]|nr:hypothetical protein J6590_013502 [Homalodisca vitripennis]
MGVQLVQDTIPDHRTSQLPLDLDNGEDDTTSLKSDSDVKIADEVEGVKREAEKDTSETDKHKPTPDTQEPEKPEIKAPAVVTRKQEVLERRLSHDKGPAPLPPSSPQREEGKVGGGEVRRRESRERSARPVSMMPVVNGRAEETQPAPQRTRSSSASNRNRRRPAPPPLSEETINALAAKTAPVVSGSDGFSTRSSSIDTSSSSTATPVKESPAPAPAAPTTVRVDSTSRPIDLDSNVTVVTTTHPPVLQLHQPQPQPSQPQATNQVIIVANETNKTQLLVLVSKIALRSQHQFRTSQTGRKTDVIAISDTVRHTKHNLVVPHISPKNVLGRPTPNSQLPKSVIFISHLKEYMKFHYTNTKRKSQPLFCLGGTTRSAFSGKWNKFGTQWRQSTKALVEAINGGKLDVTVEGVNENNQLFKLSRACNM